MKMNMGMFDRLIRLMLAVGVVVLYLSGMITGIQALVLGILAAILMLTCFTGFCPLYIPFNFSTRKKPSEQNRK